MIACRWIHGFTTKGDCGSSFLTWLEIVQTAQKSREITVDERIADLQKTRQNLMSRKELVDKQIRDLDTRIEDRKQKSIGGQSK